MHSAASAMPHHACFSLADVVANHHRDAAGHGENAGHQQQAGIERDDNIPFGARETSATRAVATCGDITGAAHADTHSRISQIVLRATSFLTLRQKADQLSPIKLIRRIIWVNSNVK